LKEKIKAAWLKEEGEDRDLDDEQLQFVVVMKD
jgi:hypothetical protein